MHFDLNRAILPPSGQGTLQKLLARVPRQGGFWLLVGSTDRSGTEARNSRLAGERTAAVARYLHAHDVDERLMVSKALPELAAPIPGYDGGLDPENRRTEVILLVAAR